jgi:two-component system response regulator HydG
MEKSRILVIDDDPDVLLALELLLKEHGCAVVTGREPEKLPALLEQGPFDVVFLDMNFSREATDGREGLARLEEILARDPDAMVIPLTAYGDVDLAVRAMRSGAVDFILKPWKNEKLLSTLAMALKLKESRTEIRRLRVQQSQLAADLDHRFTDMIGSSPALRRVQETIAKVAATDADVLILGENGTGKELVARSLHRQSQRAAGVFICVDMGAISETLFESELFGHLKGAFTDARDNRTGRFESASGGTLFLDEIGNLSLPLQAKLLRAVETREVTPVGSNKSRPVDTRLISATNLPIHDLAARREFRQDLLYRINTIEIVLPPLRERAQDIAPLLDYYSAFYHKKYKTPRKAIPPETVARLEAYAWPGNIRELKHALERAILMSDAAVLRPEDFFPGGGESAAASGPAVKAATLETMEERAIRAALEKYSGNVSRAAAELGLTRGSLYRRIRKYGLQALSR